MLIATSVFRAVSKIDVKLEITDVWLMCVVHLNGACRDLGAPRDSVVQGGESCLDDFGDSEYATQFLRK